ncbi:DNA polymerase III subunit gamma/tau [Dethiothermospora halolimnae]|uniref:DNA polymerase III subunit gamma/tau n=1 Tax=Dethiothermospora halolimnae TaxID=3114390 RepID=UPI003CCBACEB
MAYQSLYRRFRPRNFEELLGQEHVITTLKNQIINDNIAHAYLFTGTRGTGKTSTAKLFSRAVNCLNNEDGNPCNDCEVCKGILDNSIMDVVEMDAASNNSVDDIRELREKVKYPPSKGRYKVYIIDEVHMLSKGAFNALLKTLEEPPKHLIFILATTEPQKLPATIRSRCQRFDFHRISSEYIIENMQDICDKLGVSADIKALNLIARNADGAMRDALSILDQCISFTDESLTYDYVLTVLGIVNNQLIFDLCDNILNKDLDNALKAVEDIVNKGKDINQFIKDLIVHFRDLMIVKSSKNVNHIIDGTDEFIDRLKNQGKNTNLSTITKCINILSEAENESKWSSQPRIVLEISIIKLCDNNNELTIEGLLERINKLENVIKSGNITINNKKKTNGNKKSIVKKEAINSEEKKEEAIENHTFSGEASFKAIEKAWPDILGKIKKGRISIHALLREGKLLDFKNNTLIISYDEGFGFHKDAIEKKDKKEYIEDVVSRHLDAKVYVKFVMEQQEDDSREDLVEKAKNIFGDDIVEVE